MGVVITIFFILAIIGSFSKSKAKAKFNLPKGIIKETYFLGIPKLNSPSDCTIECTNTELVLTIINPNSLLPDGSFKQIWYGRLNPNDTPEILKILKNDILGIEIGEGKLDPDVPAAGRGGCLTFGFSRQNLMLHPMKLIVKYNNLPIDIRFKPSSTMSYSYQKILTFWHS